MVRKKTLRAALAFIVIVAAGSATAQRMATEEALALLRQPVDPQALAAFMAAAQGLEDLCGQKNHLRHTRSIVRLQFDALRPEAQETVRRLLAEFELIYNSTHRDANPQHRRWLCFFFDGEIGEYVRAFTSAHPHLSD